MAIASYTDLQTRMGNYLKRADLAAMLPDFIMMAEEYFNDNVFTLARRESYVITPNQWVMPLPSDWERVIDVFYGGRQLTFRGAGNTSAYAGGQFPAQRGMYEIIGNNLAFVPFEAMPNALLQIDYYATLEPLSASNVSNWLLEDSPTAYLFGSLMNAAIYIRDDARMQLWQSLRDQAIQSMNDADERKKTPENGPLQISAG